MTKRAHGFTIVELLIVIVVIAVLAAISIVAYRGVQERANDSAVQNDLTSMAKKIRVFQITNERWPQGSTDLSNADIYVSKGAYSRGFYNGSSWYNLVYCWPNSTNPNAFAIVAESKSGNVFQYAQGSVSKASYTFVSGSLTICSSAGVDISTSGRDFFYDSDAWRSYAK